MALQKSYYNYWGFSDDPFSHRPLGGDEVGQNLLVGRDKEKASIKTRKKSTEAGKEEKGFLDNIVCDSCMHVCGTVVF